MPQKYAERILAGVDLRRIDLDAIAATGRAGQLIIQRLADGENPYTVFATASDEVLKLLPRTSSEVGGPVRRSERRDHGEENQ